MPDIKFQHIVSFSSEDKNHPAENLLKPGGSHKWKGVAPGEKQISAVIQLEKACQIYSLDIGNEGSAFVEVLVGRSSSNNDQDYEVLLVSSSFMSPMESRNETNKNGVRIFGSDKLSKATGSQKWDRVKIVCTQPFNKTSTYGLSFITLHAPPEPGEKTAPKEQGTKTLGAFRLKADNEDKGSVRVGTLFAKYEKEKSEPPPITGAAAIRAASKLAEESKPSKQTTNTPKTSTTPKRKLSSSDDDEKVPPSKAPLKKLSTSVSSVSSHSSSKGQGDTPPPLKKTKSEPAKASPAKEFSKLMEGVVFVLSGYTNPRRGEVRDKALKMGAKYQSDWGKGCTHLVCAFANTPKYNAVAGKGKIVTHHWINDCFKTKKRLSWKDYRCGDAETPSESSGDEEDITPRKKSKTPNKGSSESKGNKGKKTPPKEDDVEYSGDTDVDDSGEDTEDELRRLKEKQNKASTEAEFKKKDTDLYGVSTDDDEPKIGKKNSSKISADIRDDSDSGLPELPDFFTDKKFFLFGDFLPAEKRLLNRYITAFNGEICDYMNDNIHFVITSSPWDDNFDEALSDAPMLIFVKPKWIFTCNEKNKLTPYQPHVVVPQSY